MRIITGMLLLVVLAAGVAQAQMTFRAVEGMTSTVFEEGQSSFSGLGLRARVHDARLLPNLTLLPTLEWWRNSSHLEPYDIRSVRKDATLGADLRWDFTREGWYPYVGAGFALHFISAEIEAPTLGIPRDSYGVTRGGLTALAGVGFPMGGKLENFFEAKYHHVPRYRQLKLNWGLTYKF